jgi:hypothetical protein
MRTSRPDGISQENRSHPFFILLRRFADAQREEALKTTKSFIANAVVECVVTCAVLFITALFCRSHVCTALGVLLALIFSLGIRYMHCQEILSNVIFTEVEHMIYSNDYQYQSLNNELLINKMVQCKEAIGEIREFRLQDRYTLVTVLIVNGFILLDVFMALLL